MSDVQNLVDVLAAELDRPAGVDDRHFRSIAYSSHPDGVDPVRRTSILRREAPQPVRTWLEELGVQDAGDHLRVPANAALGMAARVCVPLRFDGATLGYLWLIDEPEPLSAEQLAEAKRYADEVAVELYRSRLLERDDRRLERDLLAQLLGTASGDPAQAGEELLRAGLLVKAQSYSAIVLAIFGGDGEDGSEADRVRLADAVEQVRRMVAPHHLVALADGSGMTAVLAPVAADEVARRAAALVEAVQLPAGSSARVVAGIGDPCTAMAELPLGREQARTAAYVATQVGLREAVVPWGTLGAYRTVAALLGQRDPVALLPASFERLLAANDSEVLVESLERYLDLGGDVSAAANLLYIHRSSLYGRLHRIEEVAGVDLRSGEDRLELHLAIRLWRLAGGGIAG